MKVPLLDLKPQYAALRDEMRAALEDVCESQRFILGAKVEDFEANMAAYCGVRHAIGVSSGTDALLAALMALDVGPGDAVVTSPYTFFATAGAVWRLGATPVFVDIDPVTYNMDPARLRETLRSWNSKEKPKVLMPVHLFGQCADMTALGAIAREYGLKVVEDAAQAVGSEYPAAGGVRKAGAMGTAGCLSFFPSKNLGGFGDGGMVVTDDAALADKLRSLRNHGAAPKYYHSIVGGNFRLDALQAAVLAVKLKRLEAWHEKRRANARRYDAAFKGTAVRAPASVYAGAGVRNHHTYNQYVVRVPRRDAVRASLDAAGIGCEVYYPVPLHLQKCFSALGYAAGAFPESERASAETLAIPIYPELTYEMIDCVASALLAEAGRAK